jgi:hypothetical protein
VTTFETFYEFINLRSSEFMPDAVTAGRESPFDVEVGTADPAGTALQASFIVYADPVLFQAVHIGGANVKAGLFFAVAETNGAVNDFQVGSFVHHIAVQKQLVFNG